MTDIAALADVERVARNLYAAWVADVGEEQAIPWDEARRSPMGRRFERMARAAIEERNRWCSPPRRLRPEPGWIQIGLSDSSGRRSLWVRFEGEPTHPYDLDAITALELCAGREGDDAFVRVDRTNPLFLELLDVMLTARYAAEGP